MKRWYYSLVLVALLSISAINIVSGTSGVVLFGALRASCRSDEESKILYIGIRDWAKHYFEHTQVKVDAVIIANCDCSQHLSWWATLDTGVVFTWQQMVNWCVGRTAAIQVWQTGIIRVDALWASSETPKLQVAASTQPIPVNPGDAAPPTRWIWNAINTQWIHIEEADWNADVFGVVLDDHAFTDGSTHVVSFTYVPPPPIPIPTGPITAGCNAPTDVRVPVVNPNRYPRAPHVIVHFQYQCQGRSTLVNDLFAGKLQKLANVVATKLNLPNANTWNMREPIDKRNFDGDQIERWYNPSFQRQVMDALLESFVPDASDQTTITYIEAEVWTTKLDTGGGGRIDIFIYRDPPGNNGASVMIELKYESLDFWRNHVPKPTQSNPHPEPTSTIPDRDRSSTFAKIGFGKLNDQIFQLPPEDDTGQERYRNVEKIRKDASDQVANYALPTGKQGLQANQVVRYFLGGFGKRVTGSIVPETFMNRILEGTPAKQ